MLESPADAARAYAAAYLRSHVRDLDIDRLVELANNDHEAVRAAVRDLLSDRDPRKDVGLDRWGRLLGTDYGHELAAAALKKHFGKRELTPDEITRLRAGAYHYVENAILHAEALSPTTE